MWFTTWHTFLTFNTSFFFLSWKVDMKLLPTEYFPLYSFSSVYWVNFHEGQAKGVRNWKDTNSPCVSHCTTHNPNTHGHTHTEHLWYMQNPQHFPLSLLLFLSRMFIVLLVVPEKLADWAKWNMAHALWFLYPFSLSNSIKPMPKPYGNRHSWLLTFPLLGCS